MSLYTKYISSFLNIFVCIYIYIYRERERERERDIEIFLFIDKWFIWFHGILTNIGFLMKILFIHLY